MSTDRIIQNTNSSRTKKASERLSELRSPEYVPPTIGESLHDIFNITGIKTNFNDLAKPKDNQRMFKDEKGTFMEQDGKRNGKKIIAE